jgi:hypothetical protein
MAGDVRLGDLVRIKTSPLYEDPIGIIIQLEGDRVRVLHNQPELLVNPCDMNISAVETVNPPEPDYNHKTRWRDQP